MEIGSLIARYPFLYHMAEKGSWESIAAHGLLSTAAALDRFEITGAAREDLESRHRPEKVTLTKAGLPPITLRDQKPMPEHRLATALRDGITTREWYERLNAKVFFWASEHRLLGLLRARAYRNLEHDVLTLRTESLVGVHAQRIWLCPMNSGNTFPMPHPRGATTFRRIADYPSKASGAPAKHVVEVVVDYSVADIAAHLVQVRRMKGDVVLSVLA